MMRAAIALLVLMGGCGDDAAGDGGRADGGPDATVPTDGTVPTDAPGLDAPGMDAIVPDGGPGPTDFTPPEFRVCDESGGGRTLTAGPGDYRDVLSTMMPGDILTLDAGTYDQGLPIHDMNGSEGRCFVIEGPTEGPRAVFTGSSSRNTVSISDSSFVVIRNLELDGAGEVGDAVKAEGTSSYAHHITLQGLYIHDHDADQQIVGISTKCPAWDWVIRGNVIESSGTGIYLGNSDGTRPFVNGLIEGNRVVDTLGYNMEIKHQIDRPMLPGLPDSGTTIIRRNVFSKRDNASTGDLARPCVLVGHFPLSGRGQDDQYLVYGNFFYEDPVDALFQGEGNVALYDNVMINGGGTAIQMQPHNDVPRRVHIFGNTIIASTDGIRVTGADPAYDQLVVGNAVFAGRPLAGGTQRDNVTGAMADAATYLVAPTAAPGAGLDMHPLPGQLEGAVDMTGLDGFLAFDVDYDSRPRAVAFRGAYEGPADASARPLTR